MPSHPAAVPFSTRGSSAHPSFPHPRLESQPARAFFPHPRDRAACARFRLRRKVMKSRPYLHPHRQYATSEDLAKVAGHVERLYELVVCLQRTDSECMGLIHSMVRDLSGVLASAFPPSLPLSALFSSPTVPTQADSSTPPILPFPAPSGSLPSSLSPLPASTPDAVPHSPDLVSESSPVLRPPSLRVDPPSPSVPPEDLRPRKRPRSSGTKSSLPGLKGAFNRPPPSTSSMSSTVDDVSSGTTGSLDVPSRDTLNQSLRGLKGMFKGNSVLGS